jgi:hypothetical protein
MEGAESDLSGHRGGDGFTVGWQTAARAIGASFPSKVFGTDFFFQSSFL